MPDFFDNFDRANSATVGNGWVELGGASIAANRLSLNNGSVAQAMGSSGRVGFTIPADAPDPSSSERWLLFRHADDSNFWFFGVNGSSYQLWKCEAGSFARFDTTNIPLPDRGHRVEVAFNTTTINIYTQGVLRETHTQSALSANTNVGLKTRTAAEVQFEDFNYWVKEDGTATSTDTTAPSVVADPKSTIRNATFNVTLTANETATIYYTTDGTTPTTASTQYSAAISIAATTTLKFFGKDTAGNESAVSTETYTIDAVYPTVALTAPADGATVKGTITVSADATDNVAVASVQFSQNGTNIGPADTTAPYAVSWDTTTVPNGSYKLTAQAVDTAGNAVNSATRTVVVKNVSGSKKGGGSSKTTGRTLVVPVATSVPVGDVLTVAGAADGNSVLTSATDTKGNTYTLSESEVNGANTIGLSTALSRIGTALVGGTDTVTLNFSADTSIRVGVLESLNGSEGGAVQVVAAASGTGAAPDATITPGSGAPTLVAFTAYSGDPAVITYGAGTGFTEMAPEEGTAGTAPNRAIGAQYAQDATSGPQGSAAVLSAITDWVHITLALSLTVVPPPPEGVPWFVKEPPKFVVVKQPPPRQLPITHTRRR